MACGTASCADQKDSGPHTRAVAWPMTALGKDWVMLRIPSINGGVNDITEEMEKKLYPNGRSKPAAYVAEEQSIDALWPDMTLETPANYAEFHVPGRGRVMNMLMRSGSIEDINGKHYDRLQNRMNVLIDFAKHMCIPPPSPYNLDGSSNHAVCDDRKWPDVKSPMFGLKRLGVDFGKYPALPEIEHRDLFKNDIYYAPDLGDGLETIISCTADEVKTVETGPAPIIPQCEHTFIFKPLNAEVSIGYRRVYLKDWKAIQTAWERLLQSMIVQRTNTPTLSETGK